MGGGAQNRGRERGGRDTERRGGGMGERETEERERERGGRETEMRGREREGGIERRQRGTNREREYLGIADIEL